MILYAFFSRITLALILMLMVIHATSAGILSKEDVQRRFTVPYEVHDKLGDIPAWPLTSPLEKDAGGLVGYVYETVDISPFPGFDGTPLNFLVTIDRFGNFMDVELLQQKEPVFTFRDLGGYGDSLLREFIAQYRGKNFNQPFVILQDADSNRTGMARDTGGLMKIDGIAKATTSVRVVNQTLLTSALEVARAKLGIADHKNNGPVGTVRPDIYDPVSFDKMLDNGMIGHLRLTNAQVETLFEGSDGAKVDEEALVHPDDVYVDLYIAYLNAPTIGRAILGDQQYKTIMNGYSDNRNLWWIGTSGRFHIFDDTFIPRSQSPYIALSQNGAFIEFRDQGFEDVAVIAPLQNVASRVFGAKIDTSINASAPVDIVLTLTRAKGMVLQTLTHRHVKLRYQPPGSLFSFPQHPLPEWLAAWKSRWIDLTVISLSLILLASVLAKPRWITVDPNRLQKFRLGFLGFTLVYIGWYAQGQLSMVQITGALKTLRSGTGFGSYLYDPVSLLLIVFTLITFVVWGRGTFCGWLCPFGALQEFIGIVAQKLNVRQITIPNKYTKYMRNGRYGVLAMLVVSAILSPELGERLIEVEPFKTSITLGFKCDWPFVAYAAGLLLAGAVYYKVFCRFICPLGGAMSLGGLLRRFDWIVRRSECGKPCQRCKAVCKYDAIKPDGDIIYADCFQCLDCVGIFHDSERCVPHILAAKKKG